MKYVNWNRTRALAAVCAMVILLSATGLTAYADNAEANQADLQQVMRMGPQGRNKMQGGPRQDEQHMPFGKQDGDFAPPADGEQAPEKPDGDFAPPADGDQPPEKPDGDFAPPADGEQPPEKPDGDFAPPADGEKPSEKPDGDFAPPADGEQPPEKPDGDFAPPADGEQPPQKPEGEEVPEKPEDSDTTDQAEQNTSSPESFFGRMRRHFRQRFSSKKAS